MAKFDPEWFETYPWSGKYSRDWVDTVKAHLTPEGREGYHYKKSDYAMMLTRAVAMIEKLAEDLGREYGRRLQLEESVNSQEARDGMNQDVEMADFIIGEIQDGDTDQVGIVIYSKPGSQLCDEERCGGRSAAEWMAMYEKKFNDVEMLALSLSKSGTQLDEMSQKLERANNAAKALQRKLDREIATSRSLATQLEQAEAATRKLAESFMELHNLAKDHVGPKIRPVVARPATDDLPARAAWAVTPAEGAAAEL